MMPVSLLGEVMLSGLPASLAIAVIATLGYLIGRKNGLSEAS
ncbi:MAG TPA: hypothetical protein VGN42_10815 [Pirellulales bacterium]|jgi:hypothetical protein|nr:hypothetical protein [Pirellulales bacterium]